MDNIEHFLYNNKKEIHYKRLINNHIPIKIERNQIDKTINIQINDVKISLPIEKLNKILNRGEGVVTVNKNQLKLKKLKSSLHIDIIIRDHNHNFAESKIYSPHHNTHDWYQFKYFLLNKTIIPVLSFNKEKIGIFLMPYNFNDLSLEQIYEQKIPYPDLVDNFNFEFDVNNENQQKLKTILINYIEKIIDLNLKNPIIIRNKEKIENYLNLKLPFDKIYDIDKLISPNLMERTIIENKDLNIYLGDPHQEGLTFSKLFFEKEIIKEENNKLDKIINLSKNINIEEPIYNYTI